MIRNWIKMKKQEIQLKLTFYTCLNTLIGNKKDMVDSLISLVMSIKDIPASEIYDEFMGKFARIIYEHKNMDN